MRLRRKVVLALGAAAFVAAVPLRAQQKKPGPRRIGYLFSFTPAQGQHLWEACRQGLRELGYVEGRDIILEPRWTDGRYERLPDLVAELVRLKVD
jgi:putative ABC transport system substrate-binding protein